MHPIPFFICSLWDLFPSHYGMQGFKGIPSHRSEKSEMSFIFCGVSSLGEVLPSHYGPACQDECIDLLGLGARVFEKSLFFSADFPFPQRKEAALVCADCHQPTTTAEWYKEYYGTMFFGTIIIAPF